MRSSSNYRIHRSGSPLQITGRKYSLSLSLSLFLFVYFRSLRLFRRLRLIKARAGAKIQQNRASSRRCLFFPGKYSSRDIFNNSNNSRLRIYRINMYVSNSQTQYIIENTRCKGVKESPNSSCHEHLFRAFVLLLRFNWTLMHCQDLKRITFMLHAFSRKIKYYDDFRKAF